MCKKLLLLFYFLFFTLSAQQAQTLSLSDTASWSMVILPDPQNYTRFESNQPVFDLMVKWIKSQRERLNISLVLCTGDLVDQNDITRPDGIHGDRTSQEQWGFVSHSFSALDGVLPYIFCTGNHDYGIKGSENRNTRLPDYFYPGKNSCTGPMIVKMLPNAFGKKTLENAIYRFTTPHGQQWIIATLEFNPRAGVVQEFRKELSKPLYRDKRIVYLTHSYINSQGKHIKDESWYKMPGMTFGVYIWEQLVKTLPNSSMVFCGHIVDELSHRGHVGFATDSNDAGKNVAQMMFNAQGEGGGWQGNGGDGWLRLLEFLPDGKTVLVKTFSPLFDFSPETRQKALRTESYDQFTFTYE